MIFPYLYADMSFKHVLIVSFLSATALSTHASEANDTIRFDDGSWYLGEIADSLFNGHGKMVYADSTVYEGEWKDGLWDGKGKVLFPDGDSYEGEFKEHKFSGYGTYLYADSASYEGYWERGRFNGAGTMNYTDGSTYTGEWKDDRKNGIGVLYDAQTGALLKGYFSNDVYLGMNRYEDSGSTGSNITPVWNPAPQKPDDGKFHYKGLTSVSLSYGTGQMFSIHAGFHTSDRFFSGFQIGFNTATHEIGQASITTDDETGEKITLVGWDWYKDEILTENTYQLLKLAGECGVSWRRFSVGTALGLGLNNTVRNCRSKEGNDSYYEAGTLYYRNKITGVKFAYDFFTEFAPKFNPWLDIALRVGYSNLDRFHLGIGIIFNPSTVF